MLVTGTCTASGAGRSDLVDESIEVTDAAVVSEACEGVAIATEWVTSKD